MRFWFSYLLIFTVLASQISSVAWADPPVFSEASQRLMAVTLSDGVSVSDGIPMYPIGTEWYMPIGELSRALGLSIDVAPNLGSAQGYVLDQARHFNLDLEDCTVEHDGKMEVFNCDGATQFDNDIYVTAKLLMSMLPLKISIDSFRSEVIIDPRQKLPPQIKNDREKLATVAHAGTYDPNYPKTTIPRKALDGIIIDQQLGYNTQNTTTTGQQNQSTYDNAVTGEVLGMEGSAFFSGNNNYVTQQRYTLARRDPDAALLGPLGARDIQLIDVTIPSLPLIGGGGIYRGALISSYSLNSPTQFGTHDFIGDLPAGWEIELYQNDVLLDRRTSTNGRYEFRSVTLLYGVNRFRLAFYGPQGQRRETHETYSIDSAFLAPHSQSYRFAMGDTQIMGGHYLAQYDRSLMQNVTLVSAIARTPTVKDYTYKPITYGLLGTKVFTKNVLFSTTAASSEQGGLAWENGAQGPFLNSIVGASYARLSKFISEVYPIERGFTPRDVIKSNVAFNAFSEPTVRITLESSETFYNEGGNNLVFTQRTSTKVGSYLINNAFNFDQSAATPTGTISTITQVVGSELRASLDYDGNGPVTGTVEAQRKIASLTSVTLGFQNLWHDGIRKLYSSLTRQFDYLTLSANVSVDSMGTSVLGAILSYSVGREPREGDWRLSPKAQALYGAASVFVYLDANQNGVFDAGDKALPEVEVKVNQQNTGIETNAKGIAMINGLTPYEPADVSVVLRSLSDPFQKPSPRGLRFLPRPGKVAELNLPIIVASELTGFVRVRDAKGGATGRTRRNMMVQLIGPDGSVVKQTRTETDGYFLLEDLRAGKYTLRMNPDQLNAMHLKSEPESSSVEINADGLLDNVKDFIIEPQ